AIAIIGLLSVRRGGEASAVLPPFVLALLVGMIAFQKVGSPQFVSWLAVPVILGLVTHSLGRSASFRVPAVLVLVTASLTQVIYPYLYGYVISVYPQMLVVLTLRNLLLFVLLGWAIAALVRSGSWRSGEVGTDDGGAPGSAAPFPTSARREKVGEAGRTGRAPIA
ncbi:MAG: hypothetical protein H7146_08800, partial [Burkholderiaceae bacterium]|nr:hypothetical protein [Microbacteriaceae bacterium]